MALVIISSRSPEARKLDGSPLTLALRSLFKPIRGIVRGTDSLLSRSACNLKNYAKTIEIKH